MTDDDDDDDDDDDREKRCWAVSGDHNAKRQVPGMVIDQAHLLFMFHHLNKKDATTFMLNMNVVASFSFKDPVTLISKMVANSHCKISAKLTSWPRFANTI